MTACYIRLNTVNRTPKQYAGSPGETLINSLHCSPGSTPPHQRLQGDHAEHEH